MLPGEIEERAVGTDAGVRDHDVDAAERLGRRIAQADEGLEVANVAGMRDDAVEPEIVPLLDPRPTLAPRACRSLAVAAPMPRLAPVITATLPSRSIVSPFTCRCALDFGAAEREV